MMKENTLIVNCARGGIINEDDLYEALSEGIIGGAALDVFENEPPKGSSLIELDNVVLTPHIAASTSEAQRDAAIIVAKEIKKVFKGESPRNVINMPVMDPETFQLIKPYFQLAEKLGKFLIQTAQGNINELEVTYCGSWLKSRNMISSPAYFSRKYSIQYSPNQLTWSTPLPWQKTGV